MSRAVLLAALLLRCAATFVLVPYIQIDYAHYVHLAQCQAKCTEKYGVLNKRNLLDGSTEEYFDVHNTDFQECESGCQQHRRVRGRVHLTSPFHHGQRFWAESGVDGVKTVSAVVSTVRILCQNTMTDKEFGDSVTASISVSLFRPSGPVRYVVQWKQRTRKAKGYFDESQWITASVEGDTFFKVTGLDQGAEYRFMVTAVGPVGRVGEAIASPWYEVVSSATPNPPAQPLTLKNGYNSDRGVLAHLVWARNPQDSCFYRLQLTNDTLQSIHDITLDSSSSILLPHLEFEGEYSVSLTAVSADGAQSSRTVTASFKALPCTEIHGHGSIKCAPEPVSDLRIVVRPNGTGLISWNPSSDSQAVLFYKLVYFALSKENGCSTRQETMNIPATATSAVVVFRGHECEYVVRLINYDLIGRDALAEVRVLTDSPPAVPALRLDTMLRPHFMLIGAFVVLFSFAYFIARCLSYRTRTHRISEKDRTLADFM
ncbi:hypothetical protein Q1695_016027 [Nippostrongylus brasiliensis]|nr:hypothetical protein Q1695_016027 [Nippostrongylus brasiliensis]